MTHDTKTNVHGLRIIEDLSLDPQSIYCHPFATYKLVREAPADSLRTDTAPDDLPEDFLQSITRMKSQS